MVLVLAHRECFRRRNNWARLSYLGQFFFFLLEIDPKGFFILRLDLAELLRTSLSCHDWL